MPASGRCLLFPYTVVCGNNDARSRDDTKRPPSITMAAVPGLRCLVTGMKMKCTTRVAQIGKPHSFVEPIDHVANAALWRHPRVVAVDAGGRVGSGTAAAAAIVTVTVTVPPAESAHLKCPIAEAA